MSKFDWVFLIFVSRDFELGRKLWSA